MTKIKMYTQGKISYADQTMVEYELEEALGGDFAFEWEYESEQYIGLQAVMVDADEMDARTRAKLSNIATRALEGMRSDYTPITC